MSEVQTPLMLLAASAQLVDVGFSHLAASRGPHESGEVGPTEVVSPTFALRLETRDEPGPEGEGGFRVFLRCDVELERGPVAVEVVASYDVQAAAVHLVGERETLLEYVNEVAVMVCLPFVRQALADLTQRVFGNPLVMPIMQRGAVRFGGTPTQ